MVWGLKLAAGLKPVGGGITDMGERKGEGSMR